MVANTAFKQLLDMDDVTERTSALRRAFTFYTDPLDVTDYEVSALTILLNLTYPKSVVDDLLDKRFAKATLANKEHTNKCVHEVQWLHTHNLKYPDIRVSKQRLIVKPPLLKSDVLSGANFLPVLGWSHDSAKVNFAKLFGSNFLWAGRLCNLAELLSELPKQWKKAFLDHGMPAKHLVMLAQEVSQLLPEISVPDSVDKHSPQVRMPYRDGYLALTPVVSHALQSEIQKAALQKRVRYTNIEFTRPASVGDLIASLGGQARVLNYPPRTHQTIHSLSGTLLENMRLGKTVLNLKALSQQRFIHALDGLSNSRFALALKQRRQQRIKSLRQIRTSLIEWFGPLLDLRTDITNNPQLFSNFTDGHLTLEQQFVTLPDPELQVLLSPLLQLLNSLLSNQLDTAKYAFHQQLMHHLKSQLKWLLANLSAEINVTRQESERPQRYLYLSGIRGYEVQALSTPYCCGVPSLTAVWGMMHSYQRRLNSILGTRIRFTSFAWFIRDYSYLQGKKLPELGMQRGSRKEFRRPGILDNRYCDVTFDLVVHIDGFEEELDLLDTQPEALKASFPTTFAGGVMLPPEQNENTAWCDLFSDEHELYSKLRRLHRSGSWIMPTKYEPADFDEFVSLLSNNSSLCPTMFGYLLLTTPESRADSLESLHCYAEPAIGLVSCTNAIEIRLQGMKNFFNRAFWRLDAQEQFMLMKRI